MPWFLRGDLYKIYTRWLLKTTAGCRFLLFCIFGVVVMGSASAYKSPDTTAPSSPSLNATRPHERDPDEQTALLSDLRVLPEYGASPAPTGSSEDQRPAGRLSFFCRQQHSLTEDTRCSSRTAQAEYL